MTRVVNLYKSQYDVYIGRPGKGQEGYFGNPYVVGTTCGRCGTVHTVGESTIPCFRLYFHERIASDSTFRSRVEELQGKTLGCFCKPKPCHGDVIVEYLEGNDESDLTLPEL